MKIAAAVILYNPDEKVLKSIQSYYTSVQKLYVIDNSETPSLIKNTIEKLDKAVYIHDGENKGIAARLNAACSIAIDHKFDYLLTMDQDSSFEKQIFQEYLKCVENLSSESGVAMVGVAYGGMTVEKNECSLKFVNFLITSGSILNLKSYKSIGCFDENLFIDEVDLEYCYNARSKGYKVAMFTNIYLNHSLGTKAWGISFKTLKRTPRTLHSPLRMYYMVRNYFYVNKKYPQLHLLDAGERKKGLFTRIKNNLLYGNKKGKLIKLIIKGYFDFKKNKMGKLIMFF